MVWTIGYNMPRKEASEKLRLRLDTVTITGTAIPVAAQHWQQAFQSSYNSKAKGQQ
jgi:hypothetical protein